MPSTVNGCGTWYYGEKNVEEHIGTCGSCGAGVKLRSYDTRLYFVVFLIPVIPMGRKRIIEKCPSCTRHRVMELDEYNQTRERLKAAADKYSASPDNAEQAREVLANLASLRDLPEVLEFSPTVERNLSRDPETLRMLAAVHQSFNRLDDAERLLRSTMAVKDEEETRESLARILMTQGKPDEAAPMLKHIWEKGIPDKVDLLYWLAQSYQLQGQHACACEIFNHCEAVHPQWAKDETFVKLRQLSRDKLGSTEKIQPVKVAQQLKRSKSFHKAARIVPALLALVAIGYGLLSWYKGQTRLAYLVNGLDIPYTARLNGKEYRLSPFGAEKVRVREGEIRVEMANAATSATAPAQTVSIHSRFLTRPFSLSTLVINPDHAALLAKTRVFYGREGDDGSKPSTQFLGARTLSKLDDVDHPFEPPPETIRRKSGAGVVSLVTLSQVEGSGRVGKSDVLAKLVGRADNRLLASIARQHILYSPYDRSYYAVLERVTTPEDRVEFLTPLLKERPVNLASHVAYQQAMEQANRSPELEKFYEALSSTAPDDKSILYLHGLACVDTTHGLDLIRRAAEGSDAIARAQLYLSAWKLSNAGFDEAVSWARKAADKSEVTESAEECEILALILAGRYDEALRLTESDQADLGAMRGLMRISIYCAMGKPEMAHEAATSASRSMQRAYRGGASATHEAVANTYLQSGLGNVTEYMKSARQTGMPEFEFLGELTSGSLAKAEALSVKVDYRSGMSPSLLLFVAAARDGDTTSARRYLKAAVDSMAKGDRTDRAVAAALKGEPTMQATQLAAFVWKRPAAKAVIMTALGLADQENRDTYFSLARRLNNRVNMGYMVLLPVLEPPTK